MMMLKRSALALATLFAAVGTASAHEALVNANRQMSFAVGSHHLDYTEYDDFEQTPDGIFDTERGAQPAYRFGLGYQGDLAGFTNLYARLDVTAASGSTAYQGYLQGGPELIPFAKTTKNRFWDVEARVGKAFLVAYDQNWQFTPYLSLSKHDWTRNLTGDYGYIEYYDHHAIGAGALLQWTNGRTVIGFDAGFAKMIEAGMDTPEYDAKFSLGTDRVASAAVHLDLAVGRRGHLRAELGHKVFEYGQSGTVTIIEDDTIVGMMMEPRSKSKATMFTIGYAFHY